MEIVRLNLNEDAVSPSGVEYRDGEMQIWNGVEWVSAPDFDPRSAPQFRLPALVGDHKCDAAARMVAQIEAQVDEAVQWQGNASVATAFLLSLGFITVGVSTLFALFILIADTLLTIGYVAIVAAMTSGVYAELRCILLTVLDTNGQLQNSELPQLRAAVDQEIGGVAAVVLNLMFDAFGAVQLSNAAVVRTETGTCDCTTCAVAYNDPMTSFLGWRTSLLPAVAGDPAATWQATGGRTGGGAVWGYNKPAAGSYIYIDVDLGKDCHVQEASCYFRKTNVNRYLSLRVLGITEAGTTVYNELVHNGTIAQNTWLQYYRIIGLATFRYLRFSIFTETLGGQLYADDITVLTN